MLRISLPFSLPSFLTRQERAIDLEPLPSHDVETNPERRARSTKHLLKANHVNHAIFHSQLRLPNEVSDVLCAAYILGATTEQLGSIYEEQSKSLEPWGELGLPGLEDDAWRTHEIGQDEWRDYLGQRNRQRQYVDFYEDQLSAEGYQWRQLLDKYLYEVDEPLGYALISGSGAALLHLATAHRFNSRDLGIEALAMLSCIHDPLIHRHFSDSTYEDHSSSNSSCSVLEVLNNIATDHRFLDMSPTSATDILQKRESGIIDHCGSCALISSASPSPAELQEALRQAQIAGAVLALRYAMANFAGEPTSADLLIPLLTSDALRVLLPSMPARFVLPLLRQWLLLTILTYIQSGRPRLDMSKLTYYLPWHTPTPAQVWKNVVHDTLSAITSSPNRSGERLAQAVLALKTAEDTWGGDVGAVDLGHGPETAESQTQQELDHVEEIGQHWWLKAAMALTGNRLKKDSGNDGTSGPVGAV